MKVLIIENSYMWDKGDILTYRKVESDVGYDHQVFVRQQIWAQKKMWVPISSKAFVELSNEEAKLAELLLG